MLAIDCGHNAGSGTGRGGACTRARFGNSVFYRFRGHGSLSKDGLGIDLLENLLNSQYCHKLTLSCYCFDEKAISLSSSYCSACKLIINFICKTLHSHQYMYRLSFVQFVF